MAIALMLLLTALFYAIYNVFIKISSTAMHPLLGMLMLQAGAIGLGVGALVYVKYFSGIPPVFSQKGVVFGLLAGFFVVCAEATSFYVFSKGVSASIGIPVIIGGSVVISALIGAIFLKEYLTPIQVGAVLLIVTGVIILTNNGKTV